MGKFDQNVLWVDEYSHLLSIAWKWLGEKKTHVIGLDDYDLYDEDRHDDTILCDEAWLLLDEADVVIGHNGINFDTRKVMGRIISKNYERGPSQFKEIDTKLMARKAGFFFSNSLDDLADEMGIGRKINTGGKELWRAIERYEDCTAEWKHMKKYNKHDVDLLEQVYLRLRPFSRGLPNLATMADRPNACPTCLADNGETNFIIRGYYTTSVGVRRSYQCKACGAYTKGRQIFQTKTQFVN